MEKISANSGNKVEEKKELYEDLDILELVKLLDKEIGFENVKPLKNWFGKRTFNVTFPFAHKGFNKIAIFKYIDGVCRIWKPKWARQCRGVVIFKTESGKFIFLKMLLQRGAELLTQTHLAKHIASTQDIESENEKKENSDENKEKCELKSIEQFDPVQQDSMSIFRAGGDIKGVLSFKVDGSLLGVTIISIGTEVYKDIASVIENYTDDFHKNIKKLAENLKLPFLPIINSQGTLFLGPDMYDYILTSIYCGYGEMDYNELLTIAQHASPIESLNHPDCQNIFINFLKSIEKFYNDFLNLNNLTADSPESHLISLSFEAVCQNRKQAWKGKDHTSILAVNYPSSMLRFLGLNIGNGETTPQYIAHFQIESLVNSVGWDQPLFWNINHTNEVNTLLFELDLVINGELSDSEFLSRNPPSNSGEFLTKNKFLDYEGFVFYRIIDKNITNNKHNFHSVDYSKIKTTSYYLTHKPKKKNIPTILKFSEEAAKIFPKCLILKELFSKLDSKIVDFFQIFQLEFDKNEQSIAEKFKDNDRKSWENLDIELKRKMMINNKTSSPYVKDLAFKIGCNVFGNLKDDIEIRNLLCKGAMIFGLGIKENSREVYESKYENFKKEKFFDTFTSGLLDNILNN